MTDTNERIGQMVAAGVDPLTAAKAVDASDAIADAKRRVAERAEAAEIDTQADRRSIDEAYEYGRMTTAEYDGLVDEVNAREAMYHALKVAEAAAAKYMAVVARGYADDMARELADEDDDSALFAASAAGDLEVEAAAKAREIDNGEAEALSSAATLLVNAYGGEHYNLADRMRRMAARKRNSGLAALRRDLEAGVSAYNAGFPS